MRLTDSGRLRRTELPIGGLSGTLRDARVRGRHPIGAGDPAPERSYALAP
jgi:hypothetical protein